MLKKVNHLLSQGIHGWFCKFTRHKKKKYEWHILGSAFLATAQKFSYNGVYSSLHKIFIKIQGILWIYTHVYCG